MQEVYRRMSARNKHLCSCEYVLGFSVSACQLKRNHIYNVYTSEIAFRNPSLSKPSICTANECGCGSRCLYFWQTNWLAYQRLSFPCKKFTSPMCCVIPEPASVPRVTTATLACDQAVCFLTPLALISLLTEAGASMCSGSKSRGDSSHPQARAASMKVIGLL